MPKRKLFRKCAISLLVLFSTFSAFPFALSGEEEEEKKIAATPMADRLRYSDEEIEDKKEDESGENIILNKTIKAIYRNYDTEEVSVKIGGKNKTYMDYRSITATGSTQYKYIRDYMTVDDTTGLLFDEEGFIGAALGAYFGEIGEKYLFTLSTGVVLPIVKIEEKADADCDPSGYYATADNSVIEFLIHKQIAGDYFGWWGNGYILSGNFNNYSEFRGTFEKIEHCIEKAEETETNENAG